MFTSSATQKRVHHIYCRRAIVKNRDNKGTGSHTWIDDSKYFVSAAQTPGSSSCHHITTSMASEVIMPSADKSAQTDVAPPTSYVLNVPTQPEKRDLFLEDEGKKVMRKYLRRFILDKNGKIKGPVLTEDEEQELIMILLALSDIDDLTKETATKIQLKAILRAVLDRLDATKFKQRTRFPESAVAIAQSAWERYTSRYDPEGRDNDWGDEPENILLDVDDDVGSAAEDLSSPRPAKRQRMSSSNSKGPTPEKTWRRPSPNHPIFGENGVMKGILAGRGEAGRMGYKFDPYFNRPNFRVFGHNGCTVGDWWPLQIAACRDGAHGSIMGGIARGGPNGAATSIVISGGYKGLDQDHGDTILYSGSGPDSEKNADRHNATITAASKAMQTTHALGEPIRVFRGSKSDWKYAPDIGLRYDGLYRINRVLTSINHNGGAYIRFELKRLENQPPYDFRRPDSEERKAAERIHDYY